MLVAFNRFASEGHSRKTQLRRPSRAHARYSNDREFSTRQRAGKLPSVLKGNRKRIGKKAAQENAERSAARSKLASTAETPSNAQGGPHATRKHHPTRGQRAISCQAPSESRPWTFGKHSRPRYARFGRRIVPRGSLEYFGIIPTCVGSTSPRPPIRPGNRTRSRFP